MDIVESVTYTFYQGVRGSIPTRASKFFNNLAKFGLADLNPTVVGFVVPPTRGASFNPYTTDRRCYLF
jgi:hypothetical protein